MFRRVRSSPVLQRTLGRNINQTTQSTTLISNALIPQGVAYKTRNFRSSAFLLVFSPYINVIMDEDGEPSQTVSRFLKYNELYADHEKDINSMNQAQKDQLFYGIAAGYRSKFGELNEELTKKIIGLLITDQDEMGLKIIYGLGCAAMHKEEKMVAIILGALQDVGVELKSFIEERFRNSSHPSLSKVADYLDTFLNMPSKSQDVFNQKEHDNSVGVRLKF